MALTDVLKAFKTQATAVGMSEDQYYARAVRMAQAGDTTDLDAIRVEAVNQTDTSAITEIDSALTDSGTVSAEGSLPVLTTRPVAPTLDQQWFYNVPEVNPTFASGTTKTQAGDQFSPPRNLIAWNVPTPTAQDLRDMVQSPSVKWQLVSINNTGTGPISTVVGPGNGNSIVIEFDPAENETMDDLIAAINAYSQAQIGKDVATIVTEPTKATWATQNVITLLPVALPRDGDTVTLQINAPAANPYKDILVDVTGTAAAIVITITPNNGANIGQQANGNVTGTQPSVGDWVSFFADNMGGPILLEFGSTVQGGATLVPIGVDFDATMANLVTAYNTQDGAHDHFNPTSSPGVLNIEAGSQYTGASGNFSTSVTFVSPTLVPTPSEWTGDLGGGQRRFINGENDAGGQGIQLPMTLWESELRDLINNGSVSHHGGGVVVLTDVGGLIDDQTATGGQPGNDLADGGNGDGLVATFADGTTGADQIEDQWDGNSQSTTISNDSVAEKLSLETKLASGVFTVAMSLV